MHSKAASNVSRENITSVRGQKKTSHESILRIPSSALLAKFRLRNLSS